MPPPVMGFGQRLTNAALRRRSLLCVGLDPDPARLPTRYRGTGNLMSALLAWNQRIVEETAAWASVYKPNLAFYLRHGAEGLTLLHRTLRVIPPDTPVILDAKFGDIGSTSAAYAAFCFEELEVDAVTLNPYLGPDSLAPFFAYPGKGFLILAHTSNPGAAQFQQRDMEGEALYLRLAEETARWHVEVGLVVGATYPSVLARVRERVPDRWLLVPGVGTQGGDMTASMRAGWISSGTPGLIINVSSQIATAEAPGTAARELTRAMRAIMADLDRE